MGVSDYWRDRVAADEAKAQRLAASYSKREKQYYTQALEVIDGKIDRLYTKIKWGEADKITRTELWEYSHYLELKDEISAQCGLIGQSQITLTEACINEVYLNTLGISISDTKKISGLNNFNVKKVLNSRWSGENFSQRIYTNTNVLAQRLDQHITDMVVLGRSPEAIKAELRYEFGISYRQADRLVRTEASYSFNQASLDRYKNMNVNKVEILTEPDCCDKCAEYKDKEYLLTAAPLIPAHPNCRCCYIPVVE